MSNIAYKTAQNDPNLPDGFITEHFETDQESLPGYNIVTLDVFNQLFQNNIPLMRAKEKSNGIVTADPNSVPATPRPASDAEHLPSNFIPPTSPIDNAVLFQQFLAWVAAGKPGSPPSS